MYAESLELNHPDAQRYVRTSVVQKVFVKSYASDTGDGSHSPGTLVFQTENSVYELSYAPAPLEN